MRSSKLIMKCIAQKERLKLGLDVVFMTLNILKLDFFFFSFVYSSCSIPCIHYKLESTITKAVEKHRFNVNLSCFKQILDNYVLNICTCTLLAVSFEICRPFLNFFLSTQIAWLCRSTCFSNVYDFFLHKIHN